jgi:hypothetical protein
MLVYTDVAMKVTALQSSRQTPRARVRKRKRSYVMTSARLAAALVQLEKARAAPKALAYRLKVRRLRANHANLVKALRAAPRLLSRLRRRFETNLRCVC